MLTSPDSATTERDLPNGISKKEVAIRDIMDSEYLEESLCASAQVSSISSIDISQL
jgi:hypothetical protein